ncbi:MAG: agmatine deiminase family protein, partial [Deltaproteobacteria bacterium]|nr:agmatine deiminase family protein [Deltaproteobacteria bacterium]
MGATLPEEHPEWFGYTAPLGVDASWAGGWTRTWIAPVPGSVHQASLVAALAEHSDLTILAQGDEDHLALYEWLSDEGLSPKDMGWMDVTSLETRAAGEWGPFVLTSPEGNLLLDGRYYALRPNDDAAAGRLAEAEAAPLQRAPLFLSRSHLQGRSDGLCLAGPEIWNMNLGFTAAEITHTLHAWAGCQVLLSVPAPSADFKKRPMELYVRLEEQGVLLADSSGWSASLQLGLEEIRAVLEAAAASSPLTIHEVPWPADLDGATRSYLALVPLADAVIVPTYSGTSATESEALDVLAAFWPDRTLVTVPADAAAPLDQWPSHLVMGAAPGTWADLPSAEILCEGASPADCDLCLDECAPRAPVCTETPEGLAALDSCQAGADGCLDLVVVPCGQAQLCKDGACEDAPTTCDTLPVGGTCQGSVLVRCIAGQVVQVDCAQDGKLCAWEEDGTAACFLPCENP